MNMLTMLLKSLLNRSVTVRFPARPAVSQNYRGRVLFDPALCSGCSMCAFRCTSRAITFRATKTEYKWSSDAGQCTFCGRCAERCDSHALSMEQACPPVYLASGGLKCNYTMQRNPPAPKPAAAPLPAGEAPGANPAAGGAQ